MIEQDYNSAQAAKSCRLPTERRRSNGGVPAQEQQAEQNFSTGVALARKSRDRAIALLA
jgi:hypothetical protein